MNVLYCRVSNLDQKTDRQRVIESDYKLIVEDKCSGAIPFFERPVGIEIKKLVDNGILTSLAVWQIERLGRNLRDIISTIHLFAKKKITTTFISRGARTLDEHAKDNPISKLIKSILSIVCEMERRQIKERQLDGIRIAKLKGFYTRRKESLVKFLSKEKNNKAYYYLPKGYKVGEVAKITDLHINTASKIKKILPE